jgi:hypothetical protein
MRQPGPRARDFGALPPNCFRLCAATAVDAPTSAALALFWALSSERRSRSRAARRAADVFHGGACVASAAVKVDASQPYVKASLCRQ